MTPEQAKKYLPIVQAIAAGEVVQWQNGKGVWADLDPDDEDGLESLPAERYHIKSQVKLTVPYKRFIALHDGQHYVALQYDTTHKDYQAMSQCRPWMGVYVAPIDTEWQTHEVPSQEKKDGAS